MAAPPGAIEARKIPEEMGTGSASPSKGKGQRGARCSPPRNCGFRLATRRVGVVPGHNSISDVTGLGPVVPVNNAGSRTVLGQARSRTRRRRGRACVRQVSRSSNRRGEIRKSESGGPRGRRTRDECSPRVATEKRPGNPGEGYGEALHRVGRGREPRLQKPIWPPVSSRRDSAPSPR